MGIPDQMVARLHSRRIFYGWYIAFAGAFSNFLVLGVTIFGFQVFFEPIRQETGWTMTAILAGVSLRSFEQGLLSPFTGFLVDRLGARKMAVSGPESVNPRTNPSPAGEGNRHEPTDSGSGVVVLTFGLLLLSQAHDLWLYYLVSLIIALGQSVAAYTPFSVAVMNWFRKRRGRAIGIMNAGNAFGYVAIPALTLGVATIGWRGTIVAAAAAIFLLGIPLALVLRPRPEPYGYLPDGENPEGDQTVGVPEERPAKAVPAGDGMYVAETLRVPAFYLLVLVNAVLGATQGIWNSLQVPHLQNVGFTAAEIGFFVTVYGGVQGLLRVGTGWIGDIVGRRRLLIGSFVLQGAGFALFAYLTPDRIWLIPLFYVTYALGHAAMAVLSITIIADYFGTVRFATLRGLSSTLSLPVSVGTPVVAGWLFDHTGNYQLIFLLNAAIVITGSIWLLLIRRPTLVGRTAIR